MERGTHLYAREMRKKENKSFWEGLLSDAMLVFQGGVSMAALKIVPRKDAKLHLSLIRERVLNFRFQARFVVISYTSELCFFWKCHGRQSLPSMCFFRSADPRCFFLRYNETLRERRGTVEGRDTQRMLQTDAKLGGGVQNRGVLEVLCGSVSHQ